jgi:NADH:ubiquinone oxidoreductase subunit 4 (subunit M)
MDLVFSLIIYLPLILFFVIAITPNNKTNLIKKLALIGTTVLFLVSIYILITYSISLNIKDHS